VVARHSSNEVCEFLPGTVARPAMSLCTKKLRAMNNLVTLIVSTLGSNSLILTLDYFVRYPVVVVPISERLRFFKSLLVMVRNALFLLKKNPAILNVVLKIVLLVVSLPVLRNVKPHRARLQDVVFNYANAKLPSWLTPHAVDLPALVSLIGSHAQ
jgi:intracellular septation protein A